MYLEERKKNETHSFKSIQSHLCLNYSINIWLKVQYVCADIIEPKLEQSSSICRLEHRQILKGLSCWQLKVTNCNWLQVRETHLVSKWTEWPASLGSHSTLLHRNEASQNVVMEIKSKLCLKPNRHLFTSRRKTTINQAQVDRLNAHIWPLYERCNFFLFVTGTPRPQ